MIARTLDKSLYDDYTADRITILEAARQFHAHGWTNYVDEEYTRRVFNRLALKL